MVSVSKVESGLEKYTQSVPRNRQTSFGGGRNKVIGQLTNQIMENSPWGLRFFMKMGKNQGEILNSIVTAIGTAFIAPIFIIYNPLAKEDKDTRLYSAWRQPISAVIALAAQIGINLKFNHYLDKLASTGQLDRADLRAKPSISYLKSLFGLTKPGLSKPELLKEIENEQERARWQIITNSRQSMKDSAIDITKLVDKEDLKKAQGQIEKEFAEQLKNMSKKEKMAFLNENVMKRAQMNVSSVLENEAQIKLELSRLKRTAEKSGMSIQGVIDNLTKKLETRNLEEAVIARTQRIIEKLKGYTDIKQIKDHGDTFEQALKSVQIKKIVDAGIKNSEHVLKQYKVWGGIFISLVTLPFSCGLLNWAYPRIMEYIMPEASKAKKEKQNTLSKGGAK